MSQTATQRFDLGGVLMDVVLPDRDEDEHIDARFGAFPGVSGRRSPGGVIVFERERERLIYDPSAARADWHSPFWPETPTKPVTDPTSIDAPLRLLLTYLLPSRGGFVLHASGTARASGAAVFAALSGGGKTTTANKLPVDSVLSDDQVAVRVRDGKWFAHALPFVGMFDRATRPATALLRVVALLEKDDGVRVQRLPKAEAMAGILRCVPWYLPGDPELDTLLGLVLQLVRAVAVVRLGVALDSRLDGFLAEYVGA